MEDHHKRVANKNKIRNRSLLFFGLVSLFWLIFRTGTKPSRIVYPCQRAALANSSMLLGISIPLSLVSFLTRAKKILSKKGTTALLLIILASVVLSSEWFLGNLQLFGAFNPNQEIQLTLEPRDASDFPASDLYVVKGHACAHIGELVNLMGSDGLFFYESGASGANQGSTGLIARDEVVLIKINEEWPYRGGTNTDVLKELIQAIVDHPDGFVGEIVVADNGQWQGSMDWPSNNAEDVTQSTQDVVDMFSHSYNVSTYTWRPIRGTRVDEYSDGDMADGYILHDAADPETGIYISYPKFRTRFGTYISFKNGVWNGTGYERRLKVINMPVLKSHSEYGVTASLKHYMGVQSQGEGIGGLANGHSTVATGGMGTLMAETGLPTLNIIDAIWINANPPPTPRSGPSTPFDHATRVNVLMASIDPVALDYWAAKHVLVQTASLLGYDDTHTLDPDNADRRGVNREAFGVWLNLAKDELVAGGYSVTTDEDHMNVYVKSDNTPPDIGTPSQNPERDNVMAGQEVRVSVNVTDAESGVKNVTLFYTTDNGTTWENQTMNYNVSTSLYEAAIPGQQAGTWVKFRIIAYDNAGSNAAKDGTESYCTYQVAPEVPESPFFIISPLFIVATVFAAVLATLLAVLLLKIRKHFAVSKERIDALKCAYVQKKMTSHLLRKESRDSHMALEAPCRRFSRPTREERECDSLETFKRWRKTREP